jgi:cell division protein FtsN
VPNVVSFTANDGLTRYFTGSFNNYADAVQQQNNMLQRGFEGSFVVAFKDGNKIGLYTAIRETNGKMPRRPSSKTTKKIEKEETKPNVEYLVQIGVYKENVPANVLSKMAKIGNVSKENMNGSQLYKYYAGTYSDFSSADARLNEVKQAGFDDAFIKALLDRKQIPVEKAKSISE